MNRPAFIGYVVLTLSVVAAFIATWLNAREVDAARRERVMQLNRINHDQCASLQNLYAVIRKTLHDGDKAIDEIAYYRQFPTERARAHARNRETLERFRQPPCPEHIDLPHE